MNKMHVKTGDTVIVISGDDKGVKGEVLAVSVDALLHSVLIISCIKLHFIFSLR